MRQPRVWRCRAVLSLVVAISALSFLPSTSVSAGLATWAPGGTITAVSTGKDTTCALAGGAIYCWGNNEVGQLGNGTTTNSLLPVAVNTATGLAGKTATLLSFSQDDNSQGHACTLASGVLYCWGENSNGRLGNGNSTDQSSPVAVATNTGLAGKNITGIATGNNHTCALASSLGYCWGYNATGHLGRGNTTASQTPVAVLTGVTGSGTLTWITAAGGSGCAAANNLAYCWGGNANGQVGDGATENRLSPVAVSTAGVLGGKTVTRMAAGQQYACALADGLPYCWGADGGGKLGNGTGTGSSTVPTAVVSTVFSGKTITQLATGRQAACALASGELYCWGANISGEFGNGTSSASNQSPVAAGNVGPLAGKAITAIAEGVFNHNCAVADNQLFCMGDNTDGKLGNNSTTATTTPDYVRQTYNFTNNAYRVYRNQNSATPGAPLATTNTAAQLSVPSQAFRLRTDVGSTAGGVVAGDNSFRLQFAQRTAGSCAAQTTGWANVTGTSAIAWQTNAGVSNGAAITPHANDPLASGNIVAQNYRSAVGAFSNSSYIDDGKSGLWDFSLRDNGAPASTTYCLRLVYDSGPTPFEQYTARPEVTTASGVVSVDIVNASGGLVGSPSYGFAGALVNTLCQTTTGTLGTSAQRFRVSNHMAAGTGWSLSIAASAGATDAWSRQDNAAHYDYNDPSGSPPGCGSGSDGDGLAGQLTLSPGAAAIAPESGCSNTGLSLGSTAGYSQGVVDNITLLTASSGVDAGCYWDVTGIAASQAIPPAQAPGNYSMTMTATVVAQ